MRVKLPEAYTGTENSGFIATFRGAPSGMDNPFIGFKPARV
ncbi:MAG: hypothetical protein ACOX1Z_02665 [Candidatus Ratteibacteria bacterium]